MKEGARLMGLRWRLMIFLNGRKVCEGLALDLASSTRIWNTLLTSREHQSEKYHLENQYWKTFVPAVLPLLDCPMDMRRHEEMEVTA